MKVKVGDRVYDGEKEPVMVILTDVDKMYIANMAPEAHKYCSYPGEGFAPELIEVWMRDERVPEATTSVDEGGQHK